MKRSQLRPNPEKVREFQQRARERAIANSIATRRAKAGIPEDAPKNAAGVSCVEKTCEVCGEPYLATWIQRGARRTCSRRCAAELKRRRGGAERKGERNPNFRGGRRVDVRDRNGERRWFAVLGRACEHPEHARAVPCVRGLVLHHIVYRQHVRVAGGDEWDPRNALTMCDSCHMSHHRRGRVLPLAALPDSAFAFAAGTLGAGPAYEYLRRRYSGDDRRLVALRRRYERSVR